MVWDHPEVSAGEEGANEVGVQRYLAVDMR